MVYCILQIKSEDVDKKYDDFKDMDDPNYIDHISNLRTIVPKSYIHVTKEEGLTYTPSNCQITITGIKPSQSIDLCTSSHENLELFHTIEAESTTDMNCGPVLVHQGMLDTTISLT